MSNTFEFKPSPGHIENIKKLFGIHTDMAEQVIQQELDRFNNYVPENGLDFKLELMKSDLIRNKCRESNQYCVELYQAICNNDFIPTEQIAGPNDIQAILKGETWGASFRAAGTIVADILGQGDYLDFYCSGSPGLVTDQIREDLLRSGWIVISKNSELD